jgi:hypothetical protein
MDDKNLKLLACFPTNKRGAMANLILEPIRSGKKTNDEIYTWIIQDIERRKSNAIRFGWSYESEARQIFDRLRLEPNFQEMFDEAVNYYLDWESKLPEEKNRIKKEKSFFWTQHSMIGKEPTEKQLWMLNKNGIKNFKGDRAEASAMIDQIINGDEI